MGRMERENVYVQGTGNLIVSDKSVTYPHSFCAHVAYNDYGVYTEFLPQVCRRV